MLVLIPDVLLLSNPVPCGHGTNRASIIILKKAVDIINGFRFDFLLYKPTVFKTVFHSTVTKLNFFTPTEREK